MRIKIKLVSRDGWEESEIEVPAKYEVCPECEGFGTELCCSLKGHAFSAEEMHEDPDFAEAYFRGDYDVPCSCCNGRTTVAVPDMTGQPLSITKAWLRNQRFEREFEAEQAAIRALHARGIEY